MGGLTKLARDAAKNKDQGTLAGMIPADVKEILDSARELHKFRTARMENGREEKRVQDELLVLLDKKKKKALSHEDVEIEVESKTKRKVKVRINGTDPEEDTE